MREFPKGEMAEALYEKLMHPEKKVKCPTCSEEILFEWRGASCVAICKKCDMFSALRGI